MDARVSVDRVIHSVRLVEEDSVTEDAWVAFADGVVAASGVGHGWRALAARADTDGGGAYLTPGFIDIHGHGGGGFSFDEGPDAVTAARAMHRAHGTTRAVVSLVAAEVDDLMARAAWVADLAEADATILGSHLEGPFLAPAYRGAHAAELLRNPDAETADALLAAGRGTVRQVTIAPELPGGLDAVRRIVAAGAVAAVGHTAADRDTAMRAFDAGATVLTHAFNAMPGIHHRAPGPIVAAFEDDRVTLELIADGAHVHPSVMGIAIGRAPGRVALVTDAMAAAGVGDGAYRLGALDVQVTGGVTRLAHPSSSSGGTGGGMAGSTLTQDAAVRRVVGECGMPLPAAIAAVTTVPARAIGRPDLGRLVAGSPADAVLLSHDLHVRGVWVDGQPVPR